MSDQLEFVPYHEFVAALGDLERAGGLVVHVGRKRIYARLVRHTKTTAGQPIALFKLPGQTVCLAVTMDFETRNFYVLRRTECGGSIIPIRPRAA